MALEFAPTEEEAKRFRLALNVFADRYGLLGLLWEEFGAHLLPERKVGRLVFIAPDAVIDGAGRLRRIDPDTDGKQLLEKMLRERDRRIYAERGELHLWDPEKLVLTPRELVLPGELRFPEKTAWDLLLSGPSWLLSEPERPRIRSYDDLRRRYGVRVVFDRRQLRSVSFVATREPVAAWRAKLRSFAQLHSRGRLNRHLEGVNPCEVDGEDGRAASSWRCPSLLKALWLMLHLDKTTGVRLQRCQAPGCYEYFRVGPRGRASMYCPPPPGKKQSKCASRASSAMHRARKRRIPDPN
jgi:hypothetical protein